LTRARGSRGFTFVEIVVVLAIIGLAAAVVVPAIDAGLDSREVRRATRQIAATMHYLRTEAMATGKMHHMRITPSDNRIEADDRSRWAVLTDRARLERVDGGAVSGDGTVEVLFYANGSTSGADLVVASRRDRFGTRLRLVLDPLVGTVRVEDAS
jgi:general secretion pathway protein H